MGKDSDKRIQVISDTLWELIKDRDPEEMLKDLDIIEDEVSSFREHAESLKEAMEQEEEGEEW